MIRKITYNIIILAVAILLNSCYTVSTMTTEVLNPAKKEFPQDIYRVGVVSRMDMEVIRNTGKIDKQEKLLFERDSAILKNAVLGLLDGLAESPRFDAYRPYPTRTLQGGAASLSKPVSWRQVNSIAKKDSLDMLICLTAANFTDTVHRPAELFKDDPPHVFSTMNDGKNDIVRDDMKNSNAISYIMFPHLYWRLYDIRRSEVSEFIQIDTLIYEPGPYKGYPSKENTIRIFTQALGKMGYTYSSTLAPYWTEEERAWFVEGDYYLRKAGSLARAGNWTEASEIWRKLAYTDNNRIAARASFNMALAAELDDMLELAIEWLERATELGLGYYPEQYRMILEKRQKEKIILDNQMK